MSMFKETSKNLLRSMVCAAPWGARKAMLDALVQKAGASDVLAQYAKELGISEFMALGKSGSIQSAVNDQAVFANYARTGTWAEPTNQLIAEFFEVSGGGGTYLDIGANIGLTTIPISRNPAVRCVAFEPEPVNFANLTANVKRNCANENVSLHQIALFDRRSSLPFGIADGNLGDHRVMLNELAGRAVIQVPALPLDDFISEITKPLAVKIDTQGAEPFVIAGGRKTLASAGLVILEFSPFMIEQMGGDGDVVIDFVSGFRQVSLAPSEGKGAAEVVPLLQLRSRLKDIYSRFRGNESAYLDIIARA